VSTVIDPELRRAARAALEADEQALAAWLARDRRPVGGLAAVEARTRAVDAAIAGLAAAARHALRLEPTDVPTVLALGGYGRRELAPRSDVDLLFLSPPRRLFGARRGGEAFVEAMLYGLWDLGLEIGHAARTVDECVGVGADDAAVASSMFDARIVPGATGDDALAAARAAELDAALTRLLDGAPRERFIAAKCEERARRHARYGATVYLLEPELKNGEGGLRDLQVVLWLARARFGIRTWAELVERGVVARADARCTERALDFLLRLRVEAHLTARRRRDSLGFEVQEALAERLGYLDGARDPEGTNEAAQDPRARRARRARLTAATERLMRAYYFHASHVARVSGLVVERAQAAQPRGRARALADGVRQIDARLEVDPEVFARRPAALLSVWRLADVVGATLDPYAKDHVRAALGQLDRTARRSPEVVGELLAMLGDPREGRALEEAHAQGVLRRVMPELGRVTARWQHSLYHVYTVDVHSLFAVRELHALLRGARRDVAPELTHAAEELPRPALLALACLLHDVGKGWRSGDHAARGAAVARAVGARLEAAGLPTWGPEDTDDLAWLVLRHLEMSDVAQRRDLSDPDLVGAFATDARTDERLVMLWALTFADMRATSPKVWSDWKGQLLLELATRARGMLPGRSSILPGPTRGAARAAATLDREARAAVEAFLARVPPRFVAGVSAAWLAARLGPWRTVDARGGVASALHAGDRPDTLDLVVACEDRPGVLASIAGAVAVHQLDIVEAHVWSVPSRAPGAPGIALDVLTLRVTASGERAEDWLTEDAPRTRALAAELVHWLGEGRSADDESRLARVRSTSLARPRPPVETKVKAVEGASRHETVLDVFCPDHVGALHTIARALARQGLSIRLARVSTQGDRVADGFYVVDAETGAKLGAARAAEVVEAVRSEVEAASAIGARASLLGT
jgi:[protein-PII] uridylyltransferase